MYRTLYIHGGNKPLNYIFLHVIYSFAVKRRGCSAPISSLDVKINEHPMWWASSYLFPGKSRCGGTRHGRHKSPEKKIGVAEDTSNMVAKRQGPLKEQSLDRISQFLYDVMLDNCKRFWSRLMWRSPHDQWDARNEKQIPYPQGLRILDVPTIHASATIVASSNLTMLAVKNTHQFDEPGIKKSLNLSHCMGVKYFADRLRNGIIRLLAMVE